MRNHAPVAGTTAEGHVGYEYLSEYMRKGKEGGVRISKIDMCLYVN